ncbi:hypothetical protein E5E63_06555 [Helicobacter pylori]|nr:hypothetical protein E5E63_06555 [Helicobacter pylori]
MKKVFFRSVLKIQKHKNHSNTTPIPTPKTPTKKLKTKEIKSTSGIKNKE